MIGGIGLVVRTMRGVVLVDERFFKVCKDLKGGLGLLSVERPELVTILLSYNLHWGLSQVKSSIALEIVG